MQMVPAVGLWKLVPGQAPGRQPAQSPSMGVRASAALVPGSREAARALALLLCRLPILGGLTSSRKSEE